MSYERAGPAVACTPTSARAYNSNACRRYRGEPTGSSWFQGTDQILGTPYTRLLSADNAFKVFGQKAGLSADTMKQKFYNDPVAVLTKAVVDHFLITGKSMQAAISSKMAVLIRKAIELRTKNLNYARVYFVPSKGLKAGQTTGHLLIQKLNFYPSAQAKRALKPNDANYPYYHVNALAAYHVYRPAAKRPATLLDDFEYQRSLATMRVAPYVSSKAKLVMVGFRGTDPTNLRDLMVDLTQVALPLEDVVLRFYKNSFLNQVKLALDVVDIVEDVCGRAALRHD